MTLSARIVVGFLLLAHGLVHLLYVVPAGSDPKYPFTLARSWLLPEPTRRPVALCHSFGVGNVSWMSCWCPGACPS